MAAALKLTEDGLVNFKENVRRSKFSSAAARSFKALVHELRLYTVDPHFAKETGLPGNWYVKAYDITLTDGRRKIKCLLDPKENHLVEKNEVHTGSVISVSPRDCSLHYKETDLDANNYTILHKVTVLGIVDPDEIQDDPPYCDSSGQCEKLEQPLASSRGSYLSLWNNTDPCGIQWQTEVDLDQRDIDSSELGTIKRVAEGWKTLRPPYPALVVRVLHRGRLRYHGKRHKAAKWPYQWSVEIADRTGTCSAVFWNQLCANMLASIKEGVVLYLKTYSVRERFQLAMKPTIWQNGLEEFGVELSLNPHHPPSEIRVLHPDKVLDEWQLPDLEFRFFTREEIRVLPSELICDVVGIITYISRWERQRRGGDGSDFWLRRWIFIRDHSSQKPMILDIYSTCQPDVHSRLMPGHMLVCTQMRVMTSPSTPAVDSRQPRIVYLTTTNHSQIYCHDLDGVDGPYRDEQAVTDVVDWVKSEQGSRSLQQDYAAGGYFSYPPLPPDLESYKKWLTSDKPLQLTSLDKLEVDMSHLFYREQRRLVVQGFLIKIGYFHIQNIHRSDTLSGKSRRYNTRKRKQMDEPEPSTSHVTDQRMMHGTSYNTLSSCILDDVHLDDRGDLTILGMLSPHEQFYTKSVTMETRPVALQVLSFPGEVYRKPEMLDSTLEALPVASPERYLVLDILSLNQNVLLHALFPVPSKISQNSTFLDMLRGQQYWQQDRTLAVTSENVMKNIMEDGATLKGQRLLFVLDLYSFGKGQTEIVVNRGYSPL